MKKIGVVLVSLVVGVLIGVGNAFAHNFLQSLINLTSPRNVFPQYETINVRNPPLGPEWKFLAKDSHGSTFYINIRSVTYSPKGIAKLRILWVPRGKDRWGLVNYLEGKLFFKALFKGEDQNPARRLWYIIDSIKINCKKHQYAPIKHIYYAFGKVFIYRFGKVVLYSHSFQHEEWENIHPGSIGAAEEKYVCIEIPEPSLSSKWKFVGRGSHGTTYYVNTRSITYLPEGNVKVRTLLVPRGGRRIKDVSYLEANLAYKKGEHSSYAKRLWYEISLRKINCKKHQYAPIKDVYYSLQKTVLFSNRHYHYYWGGISPGSIDEEIEKYACNGAPLSIPAPPPIPDPSLGPEWKFFAKGSGGTTYYVNTRITYSPKGNVKVWAVWVPRGAMRREEVHLLKKALLSEGKDPNIAERLWYIKTFQEYNCGNPLLVSSENHYYLSNKTVLNVKGVGSVYPGTLADGILDYACSIIPEPSLSSKWKLVAKGSDGTTFYINTKRITYLPKGIVKVSILKVPRKKDRRKDINALKNNLRSKGEDTSLAERLWYEILSDKFNCKTHLFAPLGVTDYSFGRVGLDYVSFQHEEWMYIPTGSVAESIEKYVCK